MSKYKIIGNKKVLGEEPGSVIEIDDEQLVKTLTKAGHIEPTTMRKTRARKSDGTYKADDKSTPDVNEAWVEEE